MDWRAVALREVLDIDPDRVTTDPAASYGLVGVYSFGRGLFRKEAVLGASTSYKYFRRLKAEHIVLSQLFGWEGAIALSSESYEGLYVTPPFLTFLCDDSALDRRFLGWLIRRPHFWKDLSTRARGMGDRRRTVGADAFLDTEIPLPPLDDQRRIVARIDELAALIEEAQGLQAKAREEARALLAGAIAAAFSPQQGWSTAQVHEFCHKPQYGYTESATHDAIGPKFLRITDIQNGDVDWNSVPYCDCADPERYLLREGDILFARTGATTGKTFLVDQCPRAVFASYLIRLRVRDRASPAYLYWYLQSPAYWQHIRSHKKGTGQANVNAKTLSELRVPIAPETEQSKIVAHLETLQEQMNELTSLREASQDQLDALLPSVLDRAFKGEL
jgi:type I restriction enzyme S subunit